MIGFGLVGEVESGVGLCVLLEVDVPNVGLIVNVRGIEEGQGN